MISPREARRTIWKGMPPGIEKLYLSTREDTELKKKDMVHEVIELQLRKEEKFPGLKELGFQGRDETLRKICLEKGIEFDDSIHD